MARQTQISNKVWCLGLYGLENNQLTILSLKDCHVFGDPTVGMKTKLNLKQKLAQAISTASQSLRNVTANLSGKLRSGKENDGDSATGLDEPTYTESTKSSKKSVNSEKSPNSIKSSKSHRRSSFNILATVKKSAADKQQADEDASSGLLSKSHRHKSITHKFERSKTHHHIRLSKEQITFEIEQMILSLKDPFHPNQKETAKDAEASDDNIRNSKSSNEVQGKLTEVEENEKFNEMFISLCLQRSFEKSAECLTTVDLSGNDLWHVWDLVLESIEFLQVIQVLDLSLNRLFKLNESNLGIGLHAIMIGKRSLREFQLKNNGFTDTIANSITAIFEQIEKEKSKIALKSKKSILSIADLSNTSKNNTEAVANSQKQQTEKIIEDSTQDIEITVKGEQNREQSVPKTPAKSEKNLNTSQKDEENEVTIDLKPSLNPSERIKKSKSEFFSARPHQLELVGLSKNEITAYGAKILLRGANASHITIDLEENDIPTEQWMKLVGGNMMSSLYG